MGVNVEKFNQQIVDFGKRLSEEMLPAFHKKIVFQVLTGVSNKTRVRTGHARGNWQASARKPHARVVKVKDGQKPAEISTEAMTRAIAVLSGSDNPSTMYVFNNVNYIEYLEDGTEKMKADHMLQRTLDEVGQQFSNVGPDVKL